MTIQHNVREGIEGKATYKSECMGEKRRRGEREDDASQLGANLGPTVQSPHCALVPCPNPLISGQSHNKCAGVFPASGGGGYGGNPCSFGWWCGGSGAGEHRAAWWASAQQVRWRLTVHYSSNN